MPITVTRRITRIEEGRRRGEFDTLATEEPLEVRIGGAPVSVTMRTPGHDFELAAGFLVTEGVVERPEHIRAIRYCTGDEAQRYNVLDVELTHAARARSAGAVRNFVTTSACGLCGKTNIDSVRHRARFDVAADPVTLSPSLLATLPDRLRTAQRGFDRTGGLHAAGLFDSHGELLCLREDVGRHNAFDKVIGRAALDGELPLRSRIILASGRASFELTQKALMAGIPILAAVSAPSNLAVDLAQETGMTLVGFLRGETMNVYAGAHRVA